MAHLIGAEDISLDYPTKTVFDSLTIGVHEGDRIGIVGRNGDGKSTLMALLTGQMEPDSGRVTQRGGLRVGVLLSLIHISEPTRLRQLSRMPSSA